MPLPKHITTYLWFLLAALILCAAASLRFYDLNERPLHFDEATGARIVGYHLDGKQQPFDPKHFHGPLLHSIAVPIAHSLNQNSWLELTITPLRSVTAVAGFLTVAACLLFPARWQILLPAATFVATSPILVYYSRMYIHEPLFVFTGILSLLALARYGKKPTTVSALCFGLGLGLMAATRETVVIALFSWILAGIWLGLQNNLSSNPAAWVQRVRTHRSGIVLASVVCLLTIFLSYSQFGSQPSGFIDFFRTFFVYQPTPGHEKAWDYYFNLLVIPKNTVGVLWTEAGVLIFAIFGYFLTPQGTMRLANRFLLNSALTLYLVFSLISYKTPWLICLAWLHVCLAAAFGLTAIANLFPHKSKIVVTIIMLSVVSWQGLQSYRAAFRWANDTRNPYAYVPTSPDLVRMTHWLKELMNSYPQLRERPHVVLGTGYWPLPWYLRDLGVTGYYPSAAEAPELGSAPILMTTGDIPTKSQNTHQWLPRGLRHEFTLWLGIRKDIWQAYQTDD